MAAEGGFGNMDWRSSSEKCACAMLLFRLDTIRPIPELTLLFNVLRNAALGGGDALLGIMDRLAKETAHPELQSVPFVFWGWSAAATFGPSFAQLDAERTWRSQGLVDSLSPRLVSGLELFRTDAGQITMTARAIVERLDVVGHIGRSQRSTLVDLLLDAFLL